jgi:hypothetical protein
MKPVLLFIALGLIIVLVIIALLLSRGKGKAQPQKQLQMGPTYKECNNDNYDFCKDWKENVKTAYRRCVDGKFINATYPMAENNPQESNCTVVCDSDEYFVDTFRKKCRKPKLDYTGRYRFVSVLTEFPEPTAPQFIDIKILYENETGDSAFGLIIINNLTFTFTTKPYTDNDNYTFTLFFNNDTAFMKIRNPTDIELTTSYGIYKLSE